MTSVAGPAVWALLPAALIWATALPAQDTLDVRRLRRAGFVTLAEVLALVPGTVVEETGEFGGAGSSVRLRGGGRYQLLVVLDGVPLNELGGRVDLADVALDNLESIEVIRGPAGAYHGLDALSGAVLVRSRQPEPGRRAAVGLLAGEAGVVAPSAEASFAAARGGIAAGGSWLTTGGVNVPDEEYQRRTLGLSGWLSPRAGWRIGYAARAASAEYFSRDGIAGSPGVPVGAALGGRLVERSSGQAGLAITWQAASGLRLAIGAALRTRRTEFADTFGSSGATLLGLRDSWRRHEAGLVTEWAPLPGLQLTGGAGLGGYWQAARDSSVDPSLPGSGQRTGRILRFNHEYLRGRASWRWRSVSLDGAVRGDRFVVGGSRGAMSWRLSGSFDPVPRLRFYAVGGAAAGGAYRFLESLAFFDPPRLPGPAVKLERIMSTSVGVRYLVARGRVSISAAWLRQRFADVLAVVPLPAEQGFAHALQNVGTVAADGVEMQLRIAPSATLSARLHWTHVPAVVDDLVVAPSEGLIPGTSYDGRGEDVGGAEIWWTPGRLSFYASWQRIGAWSRVVVPTAAISREAHDRLDLGLRGTVAPRLGLVLRARNLLNESYQEQPGFPGLRRTVMGGIEILFP